MKKLKDIGELKLIDKFKKTYKIYQHTVIGIGDDAAAIKIKNNKKLLLFTTDTIVEGIHFFKKQVSGFQIGWKSLGAGISDIAAMGGSPISATVSLAMPKNTDISFINGFIKGASTMARKFAVDIVGGDTVSSLRDIMISVSVIGQVQKNKLILRNGAQPGDKIVVTGTLGASIKKKQFSFVPRIPEAQWLVKKGRINAMMDITDGLSTDLYRLINASKVGAIVYKESIPISKDALKTNTPLKRALNDGEDFELLFTTKDYNKLIKEWKNKKIPLTIIGEITKGKGKIVLKDKKGNEELLKCEGYEHFK